MKYLLDTNVFIQAKNEHYGMDFCPGFWDWLIANGEAGIVASVAGVHEELRVGKNQLARWSGQLGDECFLPTDGSVISAATRISVWVSGLDFRSSAVRKFEDRADLYLIAHALANSWIVVTHEKKLQQSKKSVKTPNVCERFLIECITPFEMLRREGALVLG